MIHFLWQWLLLPLIHWLVVCLVIVALGKLSEARKLVNESQKALIVPVPARMAEITFQVTRADGSVEPPRTYRTYRNPFMRWGWAVKQAFTSNQKQSA